MRPSKQVWELSLVFLSQVKYAGMFYDHDVLGPQWSEGPEYLGSLAESE